MSRIESSVLLQVLFHVFQKKGPLLTCSLDYCRIDAPVLDCSLGAYVGRSHSSQIDKNHIVLPHYIMKS